MIGKGDLRGKAAILSAKVINRTDNDQIGKKPPDNSTHSHPKALTYLKIQFVLFQDDFFIIK